ncbi:MAG: polyribonucleotide nucleotidyltransferase [Longimicrobiales bacterium]
MKRIEKTFAGRPLIIETGRMARQAHGACTIQYGETVVLCTATAAEQRTHLPFFPLTVEYREKFYAAGKFPGGFIKREGRPNENEVLSARLIDRPIRPLFPEGFQNETQVFVTVLSADQENNADVLGMVGTSVALSLSKIPFNGPIAGVRVGRIEGQWVLNPTFQQLEFSELDMVVAGTENGILMVEGGAIELPEDTIVEALQVAHQGIRDLVAIQKELLREISVPKMAWSALPIPDGVRERVESLAGERIHESLNLKVKAERSQALATVREDIAAALAEEFPEEGTAIKEVLYGIEKRVLRQQVLERGERVDGRGVDDIRDITCEIGLLPRTHGSALFTRGQTQSLAAVTLGSPADEQRVDTVDVAQETSKSFMLHYNMPPYAVGEVRPIRGVSRREQGHGALAERAIQPLLPAYDEFPYTIRVVSEILESNGSSSMASVCSASLGLMDAGVPLRASCAGVAMGLIKDGERVAVLTDILGVEDALGDMDFKVAGTRKGVTSIQMDIKVEGLTVDIMRDALGRAHRGRLHILDVMERTISEPRAELSRYAPRIITLQINPEKIGLVIGPKGKTVRSIQEQTGAQINIDDTGVITISSPGGVGGDKAREMIAALTEEPEVGKIYEGVVKSTTSFGAFVEILPGVEGLCHISELQDGRTENTDDVLKKGETTKVKLLSIDEKGRLRLSRKAALSTVD